MGVNTQLINELKTDIQRNHDQMEDVNKDIKKILKKIRAPKKLCVDLLMMTVLSFVLASLIWAIRYYVNMLK